MKGLIVTPARRKNTFYDHYICFFEKIKEELGFNIVYTDDLKVSSNIDVVIAHAVPQRTYGDALMGLATLNKNVKLIGYLHDLHPFNDKKYKKRMKTMLNRYDIILSDREELLKKHYPDYSDKIVFFPNFFAPHIRYTSLEFNKFPIFKCLLSGYIKRKKEQVYPLRNFVFDNIDKSKVVIIPHPGYVKSRKEVLADESYYIGDGYAKKLHSYFCCLATSSKFNIVLVKYLEIPATGSLLIANETTDLKKAGFISGEHYISITEKNAFEVIYECLDNYSKYTQIRKNGMNFVRKNHSINNRFEQLKGILEDIV
jgi:hypothetical protein